MSWNYRLCKQRYFYRLGGKKAKSQIIYSIRTTYYDINGAVNGWSDQATSLDGFDSKEETIKALELMLSDAKKRGILWIGQEKVK